MWISSTCVVEYKDVFHFLSVSNATCFVKTIPNFESIDSQNLPISSQFKVSNLRFFSL
jgi:hypothetical protein